MFIRTRVGIWMYVYISYVYIHTITQHYTISFWLHINRTQSIFTIRIFSTQTMLYDTLHRIIIFDRQDTKRTRPQLFNNSFFLFLSYFYPGCSIKFWFHGNTLESGNVTHSCVSVSVVVAASVSRITNECV